MNPHVCPKCVGERVVAGLGDSHGTGTRECPTCRGAGVVWSPMPTLHPQYLPTVQPQIVERDPGTGGWPLPAPWITTWSGT